MSRDMIVMHNLNYKEMTLFATSVLPLANKRQAKANFFLLVRFSSPAGFFTFHSPSI